MVVLFGIKPEAPVEGCKQACNKPDQSEDSWGKNQRVEENLNRKRQGFYSAQKKHKNARHGGIVNVVGSTFPLVNENGLKNI